jgi:hypothetical protein
MAETLKRESSQDSDDGQRAAQDEVRKPEVASEPDEASDRLFGIEMPFRPL